MILLVLLITLVVSTATAVSVLSVVYDRLITAQTDIQQPTIIRQTINRIIEKEADRAARPAPAVVTEVQRAPQPVDQEEARSTLLADIETSTVQIYAGSTVVGTGLFVSPDGTIISPSSRLKKNKKYMIRPDTDTTVPFSVIKTSGIYSLLIPDTEHTTEAHIPTIDADTDISLGKSVIIVGGTGDNTRLYTEIISQKRTQKKRRKGSADIRDRIRSVQTIRHIC